jgi:endoglucanase
VLPRRLALAGLLAAPALAPSLVRAQPAALDPRNALRQRWTSFRDRFLAPEGRVVDTGNQHISHSEGQGWAMLCAARTGDRAAFERLYGWSMRVLKRPGDELFSWRFRPGAGVDDPNNATDGDLFIAWALLEAGERWGHAEWQAQGSAMARDIRRLLVRPVGEEMVLLPGLRGFERAGHVVVNPSYYAFPALRALALAAPDPAWLQLVVDGLSLQRRGRFGRWRLPPDWLALPRGEGRPTPASGWPARFSYDAVRVPLYLAWAGMAEEPGLTGPARFWHEHATQRMFPAWADLSSNQLAPYAASRGIFAVAQLSRELAGLPSHTLRVQVQHPPVEDYYSAVLGLLVALVESERSMA